MLQVYRAVLSGMTSVAVKVLHENDQDVNFGREIAILRSCRHSNIVQFLVRLRAGLGLLVHLHGAPPAQCPFYRAVLLQACVAAPTANQSHVQARQLLEGGQSRPAMSRPPPHACCARAPKDRSQAGMLWGQGVCVTRSGRVMLVTEYMSGGDLWHALGRPAVSRAVFGWHVWGHKVAIDLARGLHFLHSRVPSIVHFDLKVAPGSGVQSCAAALHYMLLVWSVWRN